MELGNLTFAAALGDEALKDAVQEVESKHELRALLVQAVSRLNSETNQLD